MSVLARLRTPSGEILSTWLELDPDGGFRCIFPDALKGEGLYRLEVKIAGLKGGIGETLRFQARRGLLSRLLQRAAFGGAALISLLMFGASAFLVRAMRFPRIRGIISVDLEGEVILERRSYRKRWFPLRLGKRWILITGAAKGEVAELYYLEGVRLLRRRLPRGSSLRMRRYTIEYS